MESPPPDLAGLAQQAVALHQADRLSEAETLYVQILETDPSHFSARHLLGVVRHQQGRQHEALELITAALAAQPKSPEALSNCGAVLKALGRLDEALASYEKALALRPDFAAALNGHGCVLSDLDRFEEALASFDKALAAAPDFAVALHNRGRALQYLGKLVAARADYRQALACNPKMANAYLDYADCGRVGAADPILPAMTALRQEEALGDTAKLELDFALAKAHADLGDHRLSFFHLQRGNGLKRAGLPYNEAATMAFFDRIETVFTAPRLRAMEALNSGSPSSAPIFILGMMRSGSTLVEQILASHAQVHGGGELAAFTQTVEEICGAAYPERAAALDGAGVNAVASRYLSRLPATGRRHITDKMPTNYFFAGLIHLALPNARIIHTVRDPADTCVSCFSKLFTAEQPHTYDLAELGRYYRRYRQLMSHWIEVLPPGRMLEVRYEEVVGDLETQARRILAHCGMEWDPRCLDFHASERPVRTASVSQVRRPVYGSAVGRARLYDEFLAPLHAALAGNPDGSPGH